MVIEAMFACFASGPLNASSQHALGRVARNQLDAAISVMGQSLVADVDSPSGDQLVLTSGGSESNNLALHGIGDPTAALVVSALEHPSVLAVAASMQLSGREVRVIPVLRNGVIDLAAARLLIESAPPPGLVSVMAANNETGVIQPTHLIAEICRAVNVPLHLDATQVIGKLPFCFHSSGAAAVTFTAHKFHGPTGVGGLLLRSGVHLRPLLHGGEQQFGKRPGTESVALAVGMAKAIEIADSGFKFQVSGFRSGREPEALADYRRHAAKPDMPVSASASGSTDHYRGTGIERNIQSLRDQFESQLKFNVAEVVVHGQDAVRLPGTSCFSLPGVDRQAMLMALDLAGIACSSGSACASGSSRPSHVLQAMGVPERELESALRVGLSKFSTADEVDEAVATICLQYHRLRRL